LAIFDEHDEKALRHTFLERLMHYYHALQSLRSEHGSEWVASVEIAKQLNLDDSQVRRDLGRVGLRGHPRMGFRFAEVEAIIRRVMGLDRTWNAVLIGVGRLGSALAFYGGFSPYGLSIIGHFDVDPRKAGQPVAGDVVRPLDELAEFLARRHVDIGMITVSASGAQQAADILVAGGVKALWNFAPVNVNVPPDVFVRREHISVGLGELTYCLKHHLGTGGLGGIDGKG
jgi:redox-sensing transcriptional repressor